MSKSTARNLVKVNFLSASMNKKEQAARAELADTIERAVHAYMLMGTDDVVGIELYPLTASEEAELAEEDAA